MYASQSIISKVYCSILGNDDVSLQYREKVDQALKDLGVENPSDVPVKKMNGVGPAFARFDLSSFTAFGIWLDENYLDRCSEEEQKFHIYHEVSHYVQNHHAKMIGGCGAALIFATVGLAKLRSFIGSTDSLVASALTVGLGILVSLAGYRYALPLLVKKQEKEADLLAAATLIATEQSTVVDAHIEDLEARVEKYGDTGDAWWWYADKEMIECLKAFNQSKK